MNVSVQKQNENKNKKGNILFIVLDAPIVSSLTPIIACDSYTQNIKLECEIDSYPESTIVWTYNNHELTNSQKYTIIKNQTLSYLIIHQLQSNIDYGFYTCYASNKLGKNSTIIQLRSKGRQTKENLLINYL